MKNKVDLSVRKCKACEADVEPLRGLSIDELKEQLTADWQVVGGKLLRREFEFPNFEEAMVFVNDIAAIAESEGHHPDIYIYYRRVRLDITTHAIDGLSENDFILARKIELCC